MGYDFSDPFDLKFELGDSLAGLGFIIKPMSNIDDPHRILSSVRDWLPYECRGMNFISQIYLILSMI